MSHPSDLSRRDVLKITAGSVVAQVAAFTPALAAAAPALVFFTPAELALVDELTEILIPADDHSKGARAAGVARFLDGRVGHIPDEASKAAWKSGLAAVDALAREMHGQRFMAASPEQRLAVVTRMAANEATPGTDAEKFFVELKARTVHAYYTSSVGIHDEMEYKGNVMLDEFSGTDVG